MKGKCDLPVMRKAKVNGEWKVENGRLKIEPHCKNSIMKIPLPPTHQRCNLATPKKRKQANRTKHPHRGTLSPNLSVAKSFCRQIFLSLNLSIVKPSCYQRREPGGKKIFLLSIFLSKKRSKHPAQKQVKRN
jgi:hypothetical protein